MRIYFFNTENGLYAGESFEDPNKLERMDGVTSISPFCYERGQVPVFMADRNRWEIAEVDTATHTPLLQSGTTNGKDHERL